MTLITGCLVRVVYNQLDWLTLWYVDDYFDLSRAQKAQARESIDSILAWHRATQVPRYARVSRAIVDQVSGPPVSAVFIADRYDEIVSLWDDLLANAYPELARLLSALSDEQVANLEKRLDKENRELDKDYGGLSSEERRAKQDKAIIRAFRRFSGPLDGNQEVLIRNRTAQFHDLTAEWLKRRAAWQSQFRALLADGRTAPDFYQRLRSLLLEPNQFDSADYRARVLDNQRQSFQLVADVLQTLSTDQRNHLRKRLQTYADDFSSLIAEAPQSANLQR